MIRAMVCLITFFITLFATSITFSATPVVINCPPSSQVSRYATEFRTNTVGNFNYRRRGNRGIKFENAKINAKRLFCYYSSKGRGLGATASSHISNCTAAGGFSGSTCAKSNPEQCRAMCIKK